ncbi:hypothetical protein GJ744_001758 [Endocarpon pusillum]|uniref:ADP-ribosylation factor-like protein 8B n=2 Tax=Endocarpon pusillum TaxID=364733 RepID=A0A8H7ACS6_9EURO|nr:hypothetical protein GJ744_001758 [Endocarpon pusillum]
MQLSCRILLWQSDRASGTNQVQIDSKNDSTDANSALLADGPTVHTHHWLLPRPVPIRVDTMLNFFRWFYDWLLGLFWATEMDVTIVGLQNAGKTSLLRVLAGGEFTIDSIPTVGFNMQRVQKGHVTLKCWDLGGQPRFRTMWERYCRDVNAMVFVVDAADRDAIPVAREELHILLSKPSLAGIPLLVLGNKSDLRGKMSVDELIEALELKRVTHREISCYGISAKEETNLDAVLQWLIARSGK